MLQTSGLLLSEFEDGSIKVEYEDYDTKLGGDFSSMYDLDKENADLLRKLMKEKHPLLSFKNALKKEVGKNLNDEKFKKLMNDNNIKFVHNTWRSF